MLAARFSKLGSEHVAKVQTVWGVARDFEVDRHPRAQWRDSGAQQLLPAVHLGARQQLAHVGQCVQLPRKCSVLCWGPPAHIQLTRHVRCELHNTELIAWLV